MATTYAPYICPFCQADLAAVVPEECDRYFAWFDCPGCGARCCRDYPHDLAESLADLAEASDGQEFDRTMYRVVHNVDALKDNPQDTDGDEVVLLSVPRRAPAA
ncbi:MAG: hypothetical protein UY92_C0002G0002 [Candidatus Magasanikbacteria bacterium GW2011_GWA2_56_11]|uniref:Uncharacterized protein n=1 Tax=Candidatus Magasanikbacteria bacterium GW2011_GWA2_56_11 TaxID=1619044 RepID=A0A0G1YI39_9BACT|nr:MAG: hypothetical protein UY92_C0002G0002 [Candidatus Magasanikbacteria bacterium GW2011_GWA2_56_11]